jgi:hypothetical protein
MYEKETKQVPNFTLLRSVYDYLDIRKDGVLDINEWLKMMSGIEVKFLYNF